MAKRYGAALTAMALAVTVGAGCTADSDDAESGRLEITVRGLPEDVPGEIAVNGPDGFAETVDGSTEIDAPPGDYTLEIAPVDVTAAQTPEDIGSATWHPSQARVRLTVAPGGTATGVADYANLVPDTTKVVDADDSGLLRPADSGRTLVFAADADIAASVREGDILVAEPGPRTPTGLLRAVLAVRRDTDRVEVDTRRATLSEVAPVGRIDAEGTLSLPGPAGRRGMALPSATTDPPVTELDLGKTGCTAGGTVDGDVGVDLGTARVHLRGAWEYGEWIEEPRVTVTLPESTVLSVDGSGSLTCEAEASWPIVPLPVGVLPTGIPGVVVSAHVDYTGTLSGSMTNSSTFTATQHGTLTVGGEYVDGQPRPISDVNSSFEVRTEPVGEFALSLRGGPRIQLLIDGVAGPALTAHVGVAGTMNPARSAYRLTGGVYVDFALKLTLFGVTDLARVKWPNLIKLEREIWPTDGTLPPTGGTGGPIGPPTGNQVDECVDDPLSVCVNTDLVYGTGDWRIEPERLRLGTGNVWFEGMRWEGWGNPTTIGRGYRFSTDCVPNCASGQVTRKRVVIELSKKIPLGHAYGYLCSRGRLVGKPWGSAGWERRCNPGNLQTR